LESLYEGETGSIALRLATHFREAGRLRKALTYLRQAGDAAADVYAHPEAIAHYSQAIDLAHQLESSDEVLTDLYTRLGRALELDSQFDRAMSVYQRMATLAEERGDRRMLLSSLMAQAVISSVPGQVHDPDRAHVLGERALTLAHELGDQAAEARGLWVTCLANQWMGHWRGAIACGERSVALARELDLRQQLAQTLNDLGNIVYLYTGRIEQAKAALHEASQLWRDLDNLPMLTDSLSSLATANVFSGDYDRAIALSDEAFQTSESIGSVWGQAYSLWKVGFAHWDRGEVSRAVGAMERSMALAEQVGLGPPQTHTRADLAALYGDLGAVDRGLETARAALESGPGIARGSPSPRGTVADFPDRQRILGTLAHLCVLAGDLNGAAARIAEAKESPYRESWPISSVNAVLAEGELALAQGETERCTRVTDRLLSDLRRWGMRAHLAEALHLRGLAREEAGDRHAARADFRAARAAAEATGSRRTLWRILSALARLTEDAAEAETLRAEAREIIRYVVSHTDETELRASFLSLPEVRAVLRPAEG
jgi:tetratricopeptide (TPR) repeat protein